MLVPDGKIELGENFDLRVNGARPRAAAALPSFIGVLEASDFLRDARTAVAWGCAPRHVKRTIKHCHLGSRAPSSNSDPGRPVMVVEGGRSQELQSFRPASRPA